MLRRTGETISQVHTFELNFSVDNLIFSQQMTYDDYFTNTMNKTM